MIYFLVTVFLIVFSVGITIGLMLMTQLKKQTKKKVYPIRYCWGKEIPRWCIGDSVNSYKYDISLEEQKKVREWYQENMTEYCETIKNFRSNWIGRTFGTQYYSTPKGQYRLCVGKDVYA